jgi:Winged helix DNA-binding domain
MQGRTSAQPLGARALNRALLARQLLLERSDLDLVAAVEQMGGIQAQYAPAAYIGLWSRLRNFERDALTRALEDRSVVQGTLMRSTIHIVSAADYWPMAIGIGRARREWFSAVSRRELDRTDMEAVGEAVRDELADGPLPIKELTSRIAARGFPPRTAQWAGMWVDLVRVPPSGTWERRRADLFGLAESWIPRPNLTEAQGLELLVRRYLGAFGPAPLKDVANWIGINVSAIRGIAAGMPLRRLRDEDGSELLDLPDAPLPDPDAPAPVSFLAVWDAALLVHARRTHVLPEDFRPRVFNTKTPHSVNTFLLDGQVAGSWRIERGELALNPFRRLRAAERREVEEAASPLVAFHEG